MYGRQEPTFVIDVVDGRRFGTNKSALAFTTNTVFDCPSISGARFPRGFSSYFYVIVTNQDTDANALPCPFVFFV